MSILVKVYYSLLTDTEKLTGIHLDLPDNFDVTWVLIEGPALDKRMLQHLEGNSELPSFPEWLLPLWEGFVSNERDRTIPGPTRPYLRCLRTLLVFGYKAEHEPTKQQLAESIQGFCDANAEVGAWNRYFKTNEETKAPTFREARRLVGLVIGRLNWFEVLPRHGPGAVFPRSDPCNKGNFDIYTPIAEFYPYDTIFNGLPETGILDRRSHVYRHSDQIACRMTAVPKDSRGPRLISVHPKESIWVQQGQRRVLERAITSHKLTSGRINFSDQTVNGRLALTSSADQSFTTIDLKEASDRVGKALVDYLFGWSSKVLGCSRADRVLTLDNRLEGLEMWAPMGNCLTFPVESLVFWALVRAGILSRHGVNCDEVYVFGDDIIVPTVYYDGAIYGLIMAGLIPNYGKTFRKGLFRESCGVDAYRGKDVTPYRMKVRSIVSYSDGESLCDLAKRLRLGGYPDTSAWIYSKVSQVFGRLSLTNNPDCQGMIEYMDYELGNIIAYEPRLRYNKRYHRYETPYLKEVRTVVALTNHAWWHVQESLLLLERKSQSISDENPMDDESLDKWEKIPTVRQLYNDRRLEYPTPRGVRLHRGYCQIRQD